MSKLKIVKPTKALHFVTSDGATFETVVLANQHEAGIQIGGRARQFLTAIGIELPSDLTDGDFAIRVTQASAYVDNLYNAVRHYAGAMGKQAKPAAAKKTAVPAKPAAAKKTAASVKSAADASDPMTIEKAKKIKRKHDGKRGRKPVEYHEAVAFLESQPDAVPAKPAATKKTAASAKSAADASEPMTIEKAKKIKRKHDGKRGRKPAEYHEAVAFLESLNSAEGAATPKAATSPAPSAPPPPPAAPASVPPPPPPPPPLSPVS